MVTLVNREKRIQVFNLPAPAGEASLGTDVTMQLAAELEDGTKGTKIVEKHLPGSVTLLAGGQTEPLPDWVASCPEVKAALDRGAIKLIKG